jgi:hypothetical protein
MKESRGFVNQHLDNAKKFYSTGLKQFKFYKKLLGTKVVVSRGNNSDWNYAFGSVFTDTSVNNENCIKFDYTVLINLNDMKDIYLKMVDPIDIYDNEDTLKKGDLLTFARGNQVYNFRVTKHETFSEAGNIINKYILGGIIETNDIVPSTSDEIKASAIPDKSDKTIATKLNTLNKTIPKTRNTSTGTVVKIPNKFI